MKNSGPEPKSTDIEELRSIRKLLTALLLATGVEAKTVSKILGYKSPSAITNKFPVRELQKKPGEKIAT